jgi:hypothetical protein
MGCGVGKAQATQPAGSSKTGSNKTEPERTPPLPKADGGKTKSVMGKYQMIMTK